MSPYSPSVHSSPAVQLSERKALGKGKRYRAYLKTKLKVRDFVVVILFVLVFQKREVFALLLLKWLGYN